MNSLLTMPCVWAQTTPDEEALPILSLRRWFWSSTLASPEAAPEWNGLWAWISGLAALFVIILVVQGPSKALRQLFDLPGHVELVAAAWRRLKSAGRVLMATLGLVVLSWTFSMLARYDQSERLTDLTVLLRSKAVLEVALEQGALTALTPLRDLFSLSDLTVLVALAAVVVFRHSADRWSGVLGSGSEADDVPAGRTTLTWLVAGCYGLYRIATLLAPTGNLPLEGCLFVDGLVIPAFMLTVDGLLLAWVLTELSRSSPAGNFGPIDVAGALRLLPASMSACLLAMPARYLALGAYLALPFASPWVSRNVLGPLLGGWGLVTLQGAALVMIGLCGAVPWGTGGVLAALRGYTRLLRTEGGFLWVAIVLTGLALGFVSGLSYLLVLSLPPQPWVLMTADAYAHYLSLPIGLLAAAAFVELGGRSRDASIAPAEPLGAEAELERPDALAAD